MAEIEHVTKHKEEMKRKIEELQKELNMIEELKLDTRHDMQPHIDFTMFDAIKNSFLDICGYDLESNKVILFSYALNSDYLYYDDVEMWDCAYMEVSFETYKKEYLPLFKNKEKGLSYLSEVEEVKTRNKNEAEEV